jgi:hypothetical protein
MPLRIASQRVRIIAAFLVALATAGGALHAEQATPAALADAEVAAPPGLPAIGKWMFGPDGAIAHWLGQTYEGKHLHEPINVILVDAGATSADHAR